MYRVNQIYDSVGLLAPSSSPKLVPLAFVFLLVLSLSILDCFLGVFDMQGILKGKIP